MVAVLSFGFGLLLGVLLGVLEREVGPDGAGFGEGGAAAGGALLPADVLSASRVSVVSCQPGSLLPSG